MARKLILLVFCLFCFVRGSAALTLQSVQYEYPPATTAGLSFYATPPLGARSVVTDATAVCSPGTQPTGGGSNKCRIRWNGAHWVEISGAAGGTCPVGSTLWTTGVSDHIGITWSCSGSGTSKTCTHSSPVTADVTANSANYTIHGYTPTTGDKNKHLIIGTGFGLNCSSLSNPCLQGAGGNSFPGETLEVSINAVSGQVITGTTYVGGSSSASAVNSLSGVEADIETNNGPALQTLVNSLPTNSTICVPAGNFGIDTGVQMGTKNITFFGLPGATFYNMRNSRHDSFFDAKAFTWVQATGGGAQNLTMINPNIGGMNQAPFNGATATLANWNHDFYSAASSGLTFSGMTDLFIQSDSDIELSGVTSGNTEIGTSLSTVTNNYTQTCWAYGPSLIFGDHNTFSGNIMRNCGHDVEPNTDAAHCTAAQQPWACCTGSGTGPTCEGQLTHDNTFTGFTSIHDPAIAIPTGGIVQDTFGAAGQAFGHCPMSPCGQTEIVNNGTFTGNLNMYPQTCSGGAINCTGANCWSNITKQTNSTGSPVCFCDSSC